MTEPNRQMVLATDADPVSEQLSSEMGEPRERLGNIRPGVYAVPSALLELGSYWTPSANVNVIIEEADEETTDPATMMYLRAQGLDRCASVLIPMSAGFGSWEEVSFMTPIRDVQSTPAYYSLEHASLYVGRADDGQVKTFLRCDLQHMLFQPSTQRLTVEQHSDYLQRALEGEPFFRRLVYRGSHTEYPDYRALLGDSGELLDTDLNHTQIMVPVPEDGVMPTPFTETLYRRALTALSLLPGSSRRAEYERTRFAAARNTFPADVEIGRGILRGNQTTLIGVRHGDPKAGQVFKQMASDTQPTLLIVEGAGTQEVGAVLPEVAAALQVGEQRGLSVVDPIIGPSRVAGLALEIFNTQSAQAGQPTIDRRYAQAAMMQSLAISTNMNLQSAEDYEALAAIFHVEMGHDEFLPVYDAMVKDSANKPGTYTSYREAVAQVSNAVSAQVLRYLLDTQGREGGTALGLIGRAHLDIGRMLSGDLPIPPSISLSAAEAQRLIAERDNDQKSRFAL